MNINVILEIFQKNKKLCIVIYIILVIGISLFIWWPKDKKVSDLAKYEPVNTHEVYQSNAQKYVNNLTAKFRLFGQASITELLDSKMTYHYSKTRSELISELEDDGYFDSNMYMTCSSILELGEDVVYVTKLYSGQNYRTLNIIESAPNKYKLTLDTCYKYSQPYSSYTSNNVSLNVQDIYQDMNYVEYSVEMKNIDNVSVTVSLDRTSDVYLILEDGTTYGLSNVESEVEDLNLSAGSTFNRKLIFNVPVKVQDNILAIVFDSVGINGNSKTLRYNLAKDGE